MVQGSHNLELFFFLKRSAFVTLLPSSVQFEAELPAKCYQEANTLYVPRVSHQDSGIYVCTASNKQGKVEAFTLLQVLG